MNGGDPSQQQMMMQQQRWMAMQQYQQQWMAMQQYPAAAMAMQQQVMYGQHYVPYYHQQTPPPPPAQGHQKGGAQIQSSSEDNRTIWIGDLLPWMDESYLHSCFSSTSEVLSVKIIRNKHTGLSERYGFVEFNTHAAAEEVLQSYNETVMPNTEQTFRLNWGAFSTTEKRMEAGSDLSIFVGDLASDVTDEVLRETFANRYSSVKGAKVVVDANSGRSKGYGFVRFSDENERSQAIAEMNGVYCSSRPMRIGVATPKKQVQQQYSSQVVVLAGGHASNGAMPQGLQSDSDLLNTTIFVGGLDPDVNDEELKESFAQFGEIVSVKIPVGKGCGFVQFVNRNNAEDAMEKMNGATVGKQTVRISWGRNPGNKQFRSDGNNQWSRSYYGRQNYGGYGNGHGHAASQNQDQGMYAADASSNGYGNHQQPVST